VDVTLQRARRGFACEPCPVIGATWVSLELRLVGVDVARLALLADAEVTQRERRGRPISRLAMSSVTWLYNGPLATLLRLARGSWAPGEDAAAVLGRGVEALRLGRAA
jgi:hypothetical protein